LRGIRRHADAYSNCNIVGHTYTRNSSNSEESADAALADLDSDLKSQRLVMVDLLWRAAIDRAVELSRKRTPELGSRMLDVFHVASALELGSKALITYDERQIELTNSAGLKTVSP
jgi:predicted nucleic acid-binding protein